MIELKDPIKISKVRKKMNPPIPLVMRIIMDELHLLTKHDINQKYNYNFN
jgi:hypothetical protein